MHRGRIISVSAHTAILWTGVLWSGFNYFKTAWLSCLVWLLLLRNLMQNFQAIHSVDTYSKKPAPKSSKFFKYEWYLNRTRGSKTRCRCSSLTSVWDIEIKIVCTEKVHEIYLAEISLWIFSVFFIISFNKVRDVYFLEK